MFQNNLLQKTVTLPQLALKFSASIPKDEILFLLGGDPPASDWLIAAAENRPIWCIDHGIDACKSAGLDPALLIGDGDSASKDAWNWGNQLAIPIEQHPTKKDFTDTQLALLRAEKSSPALLILTGAFGGRFDHAYSTIYSAAHAKLPCILADDREILFFLRGDESVQIRCKKNPLALSLLPITESVEGVSTAGLLWELHHTRLTNEFPNAISNEFASGKEASIQSKKGILAVYLHWKQ